MFEIDGAKFRTLDDFDPEGKRVLVRVDFNSPLVEGRVQMNERIEQHALTLKELADRGAKVVALAHQGRKGKDFMESLEQHAELAGKFVKMDYVDDLVGEEAVKKIQNLENGQVLLLKNVRSLEDEFKPSPDNVLVEVLNPLFHFFINDAFSVCHREQTSVVSFPEFLPSYIGKVMEKELSAIKNLKTRKMLYILGGAKPKDNLVLVRDSKVNKILSTGVFSLLCLMAKGYKLGKEDEILKEELKLVPEIRNFVNKINIPLDLAIDDGGRKEIKREELPVDKEILDIGQKTVDFYAEEIGKAEAVFMKGPAGKFEEKEFAKGTLDLLETIGNSKCFSLIGGGHSSHIMELFNINKDKFSHISLAGGALIAYLAGKKLPGLEVLKV